MRIVIEFEEIAGEKRVEVRRKLQGEPPTEKEGKLAVYYLLALARGIAHFGLEQNAPCFLETAAGFVSMARDVMNECKGKEKGNAGEEE